VLEEAGEEGMFRREISEATGLALKTVKNRVKDLIDETLVEEHGEAENQTRRVRRKRGMGPEDDARRAEETDRKEDGDEQQG